MPTIAESAGMEFKRIKASRDDRAVQTSPEYAQGFGCGYDMAASKTEVLLGRIADEGVCRGCSDKVWWIKHKSGARAPYDPDGTNHFITCPERDRFRRKG